MGIKPKARKNESDMQPSEWSRIIGTHSYKDDISRGRDIEYERYDVQQTLTEAT